MPRMSLADYLKPRVIEAVQNALAETDGVANREDRIAESLEALLQSPRVKLRMRKASAGERLKVSAEMGRIVQELHDLNAAPPSLLVVKQPPMLDATAEEIRAATTEASATVIATSDEALRVTAAAINPDAEPPTSLDIGAWIGECPPGALAETEARIAALYGLDPASVRVTGWAWGQIILWLNGERLGAPAGELRAAAFATGKPGTNPLGPLVRAWLDSRSMPLTSRNVQAIRTERGTYSKTPGLMAVMTGALSIVKVDGEPFASRMPLIPESKNRRTYRPKQEVKQGELLPGPRRLNGVPTGDMILASLDQWNLSADDRTTLRHDILRMGRAAMSLTGPASIPEDVGAKWLTQQAHATAAAKQRFWDTLEAMRSMTVRVDPKTHEWFDMWDVRPQRDRSAFLGPPSWWVESRKEDNISRAWRLSGGLWRPAFSGGTPARGTSSEFWGALARTVDGIEAALAWGPTRGNGKGGRLPVNLLASRKGGAGPEVFIPWRNILRLSGESASDDVRDETGALRKRYNRRLEDLRKNGYMLPRRGEAVAGDTIEIVRRVDGRGRGREAGLVVRASARFVEAYKLSQDAFELIPASQLFLPPGRPEG